MILMVQETINLDTLSIQLQKQAQLEGKSSKTLRDLIEALQSDGEGVQ